MSESQTALKFPTFLKESAKELSRRLPESLFMGIILSSLLLQSFPLGVLALACFELLGIQSLFAGASMALSGTGKLVPNADCFYGVPTKASLSLFQRFLRQSAFPSGPIFFISGLMAYNIWSAITFREELDALAEKQPEWKARIPIAVVLGILLTFTYVIWTVANGCETTMTAIGSVLLGTVIGVALCMLHAKLFGKDSVNMLGLPLLIEKVDVKDPLYVCGSTNS